MENIKEQKKVVRLRNILLFEAIREVDNILDFKIGIIKGAALIIKGFYKIDEREMSDIDIIVEEKNHHKLLEIIYKIGFNKIPDGRNSYYKLLHQKLPPVIFDIHRYFLNISFNDFEFKKVYEFNNIFVPEDAWCLITTAVHGIINHGFFDKKDKEDVLKILKHTDDENIIEKAMEKARKYNYQTILKKVLENCGYKTKISKYTPIEYFSIPFLNLAFKKYFTLNEYILPLFYNRNKTLEFFKNLSFKKIYRIFKKIILNRKNF